VSSPVASAAGFTWAADAQPKLIVTKGLKMNIEYPIYQGQNFIGRADDKAVDIDLDDQEQPDRVWSSRQHAVLNFENGVLTLEDLNSGNGTFLNRAKLQSGQKPSLKPDDTIQIGTVQFKVKA
jgi:pSer/pThr/pTyr-binding forkhead associated (FHA) protein